MILKLPLHELTAMARDVVAQHHYEAVGAVPAEGDSAYAELVVALNADLDSHGERLTIGVHRTEPLESIRKQIERRLQRRMEEAQ